ncbi:unnamed protein product [Arctogadus glacialis]
MATAALKGISFGCFKGAHVNELAILYPQIVSERRHRPHLMPSIPRDEELGPHTRHRYSNVFPSLTARVLVVTLVDKELFAAGPFCWL